MKLKKWWQRLDDWQKTLVIGFIVVSAFAGVFGAVFVLALAFIFTFLPPKFQKTGKYILIVSISAYFLYFIYALIMFLYFA